MINIDIDPCWKMSRYHVYTNDIIICVFVCEWDWIFYIPELFANVISLSRSRISCRYIWKCVENSWSIGCKTDNFVGRDRNDDNIRIRERQRHVSRNIAIGSRR